MASLMRETRLQIMLADEELVALDNWRFEHRMPSRAAAIRHLLSLGLRATQAGPVDGSRKSAEFGLLGGADR